MAAKYDYVIVGAGSAGCVLADRLSEDGKHSVLILEAGGSDRRFWIQTPIGYGKLFFDERVNWKYTTEPDPGTNHRRSYWPRGKVLGGSSSINAMVFIRGNREDFEDWKRQGNPGWGWDDVLPYFRRLETFSGGGSALRGDRGPLYVNDVHEQYHPLCKRFIEAAQQRGFRYNPDFNGEEQEGVGYYQINTRDGRRMSAAGAYLHPARKRTNCMVETHAQVTRILFDGKRATGVEYRRDGHLQRVDAVAEVIVSAGAVNSPQILQLSGIGDPALLRRFDIETINALPAVGRNLQDHVDYCIYYRSKVPTLNNQISPWWGKLGAGIRYLLRRDGWLSLSVNQSGGFVRSHPSRPRPNLQMYFNAITYTTSPAGKRPLIRPDPWPGFIHSAGLCRPESRGSIEIVSPDPLQPPRIEPNYLSVDSDVEQMLEAAHLMRKMAGAPALAEVIDEELTPGPALQSDDELVEDIRNRCTTVFHPSCTNRMGPDPANSVVDADCRVHGTESLRVVDASVFPNVTSGNTNAPTIMLAEKAADLIRGRREVNR